MCKYQLRNATLTSEKTRIYDFAFVHIVSKRRQFARNAKCCFLVKKKKKKKKKKTISKGLPLKVFIHRDAER